MARLPREFIQWNYFARRELLRRILEGQIQDPSRIPMEFTRHNPTLCTAAPSPDGSIEVNGKVIGVGYVPRRVFLGETIRLLEEHLRVTDEAYTAGDADKKTLFTEHAERGLRLLLHLIYLEPGVAEERIDFEKLASIELAFRLPHSSKHTWSILQRSRKACLVFYQPPSVSFEVRCSVSIHLDDEYHKLVNLVHDAYHYTPPNRRADRPVYLFHVEEVFDNSPTPEGFGRKIA